jgi:Raf kinase inhibitor-like YbhB/YbcL family protein
MELRSDDFNDGERLPVRFAAGRPDGSGRAVFSDNVNPHLAWSDVPDGTRSFVLICHDPDVPSRGDDVNQPKREVPADLPRVDFFHWTMVDLPGTLREIARGEFSDGFMPRGKPGPATLHGARHGLNDFTGWFATDPTLGGHYFGYDGPFPPFNDAIEHRYVFTLYALSVRKLAVEGNFTGPQARAAMSPHVIGEAAITATYTLNPRLL